MRLIAFRYGSTYITERMAFQDGREDVKIPIGLLFFLLEHEDRKLLIDVGCDTMPGFLLTEFQSPVEVLESCGVKRTEITDVFISHAHHDHIDALRYYPQAVVHIQRNEAEEAGRHLKNAKNIAWFDSGKTLWEGAEILHIGGHSAGSSVLTVSAKDKTFVLCGDECYTKENLIEEKPTGSSVDIKASEHFVKTYGKPPYVPVLFHDNEIVEGIGWKVLAEE
ncbi:MAG: MBL fold metallo-hydrolase [Clostridia bacterium]|nr:MBL fold metallo-hydrolase [Clostridia bacterium]